MDNIFYRTLLNDKIKIEPKYISKDFRTHIFNKLKKSVEGVCTQHGYIKEGSVELYKVSPGTIDLVGLNGYVLFDTYYYADVCNPMRGNVVKATVMNVNKFGILADVMGILEIVIAKNSVNIVHDNNVDLEKIKIGDSIMIEVMGNKYELFDKKISVVGRVVSDGKDVSQRKRGDDNVKVDDEEEDDLIPDDDEANVLSSDGEEESNEEEEDDFESSVGGDEDGYQGGAKDSNFFDSDDEEEVVEEFALYSDDEEKEEFSEEEEDF